MEIPERPTRPNLERRSSSCPPHASSATVPVWNHHAEPMPQVLTTQQETQPKHATGCPGTPTEAPMTSTRARSVTVMLRLNRGSCVRHTDR